MRLEFTYDGGGLGKGATADLYLDGTQVATGRIDATVPLAFSGDETLDVGSDTGTPVSDDYTSRGSHFTGRIHRVQIDLGDDAQDNDHLISPRSGCGSSPPASRRVRQSSGAEMLRNDEGPAQLTVRGLRPTWQVQDSNLRRNTPTDLQSAPIGRSGNLPGCRDDRVWLVGSKAKQ